MRPDLRRLRAGELLSTAACVLMLISLFALRWYARPDRDGWQGATHARWLLLVAIAVGLATVIAQILYRAPAIPASLDVVAVYIALLTVLWLLYRVAINPGSGQQAGAWLELLGAVGLLAGVFVSLRQEGILERDGPGEIPVIDLGAPGRRS
jgi:hypothetical protein